MDLTDIGAKTATAGAPEKSNMAGLLIQGNRNINEFTRGVCFDAAAYVRYLLGAAISPDQLKDLQGPDWVRLFSFRNGTEWDGVRSIPAGSAVGFFRVPDQKIFHAAIATGNANIRAVNGLLLGNGWSLANLNGVLKQPNDDGTFNYDGTQIRVYISKL
jgi:hypothetical protein